MLPLFCLSFIQVTSFLFITVYLSAIPHHAISQYPHSPELMIDVVASYPSLIEAFSSLCLLDGELDALKLTKQCVSSTQEVEHPALVEFHQRRQRLGYAAGRPNPDDPHGIMGQLLDHSPYELEVYFEIIAETCVGLPSLASFAFVMLDLHDPHLSRFWSILVNSTTLHEISAVEMDLTGSEGHEFNIWFQARNVKFVRYISCIIDEYVGYHLSQEYQEDDLLNRHNKDIMFENCIFTNIDTNEKAIEFGRGLGEINGLRTITFYRCTFDERVGVIISKLIQQYLPPERVYLRFTNLVS